MITVLLLAAAEKLINYAISTDQITQAGLSPLAGKVLRVSIAVPELNIDVVFSETRLRFEPVSHAPFTGTEDAEIPLSGLRPDCHIEVANLAELMNLLKAPEGNLPISGDYKVLMQLKTLLAGFDPDIAGQLEPLVGVAFASQLTALITHLKGSVKHTASHTFDEVTQWANDVAGNRKPDPAEVAESNDLKQQLLKLRADIQREEARLAAIKAEIAKERAKLD